MITNNKCCITLNATLIDTTALKLVCVDDLLFRDLCATPSDANEQANVRNVLDSVVMQVETYLQRSLLIDLYEQDLCDCFCDCCNTYLWAYAFPVHRIIDGKPIAPSQTPATSTRHFVARGDTGGQRLNVANCCGEIMYYAGYAPCGATLSEVNAMLYALHPQFGTAQLTQLPPSLPSDILQVILDLTRYYLAIDRKDMIGIQTKEETSAKGDHKRTTMLIDYRAQTLKRLAKYRKL